jgi:transposase
MTSLCAAGVDVGRDYFDVGLAPSGQGFRVANAARGIETIITRLKTAGASRVVLESIGGYGARLVRALAEAGFEVGVIDPKRIKALRTAEGKRAKTDALDAALIARFALIMSDAARPVPSARAFEIRALSTRRRQLVEMIAMEKTRLGQTLDEPIAKSCRQVIAHLAAERAAIEARLAAEVESQDGGRQRRDLLQTIPGVGPAISLTLLADLPELGGLDRKAVASLAGLAPHPNQSGTRASPSHIHGGRPCVRAALYIAAVSATRSERGFKREYLALRAAGKPAKVALVAIARRIAVAANAILRSGQPWQKP